MRALRRPTLITVCLVLLLLTDTSLATAKRKKKSSKKRTKRKKTNPATTTTDTTVNSATFSAPLVILAVGCFLLTEVQAGVLSGLIVETTATWDADSDSFVLHTPSDKAAKVRCA